MKCDQKFVNTFISTKPFSQKDFIKWNCNIWSFVCTKFRKFILSRETSWWCSMLAWMNHHSMELYSLCFFFSYCQLSFVTIFTGTFIFYFTEHHSRYNLAYISLTHARKVCALFFIVQIRILSVYFTQHHIFQEVLSA